MIMNFKKYTLRTTLASVFMLLLIGLIFFTRANGLPDRFKTLRPTFAYGFSILINADDFKPPPGSSITKISDDMNRYENREWLFAFNIPVSWQYPPPAQQMFDNHIDVNGFVSFGSNENGYHRVTVNTSQLYRENSPPQGTIDLKKVDKRAGILVPGPRSNQSPKEACEDMQQMLSRLETYEDINLIETSIGSSKAYRLDFVSKPEGENVEDINWRIYFFADKGTSYKVVFGTTNKETMSDLFDKIAMSFEILPEPLNFEMKPIGNIYDFYSLDIPMRWHFSGLLPVFSGLPDLLLSGFNSHDDRYDALAMTRKPVTNKQTVKEYRYEIQRWLKRKGADNFKTSETTIGSNDAMVLDCTFNRENEVLNIRGYFMTDNKDFYGLLFSTNDGGNMPELYERIASSFKFTDSMPDIECPPDYEYDDFVYKPEEVDQKPKIFDMNDLPGPNEYPGCMSKPGFKKGVLEFVVGTDGYVHEPEWYTEPEGACGEWVEEKILDYVTETRRFKPAVKDGKCVKCSLEVTVEAGAKISNW